MPKRVFYLLYTSLASRPMKEADLFELLEQSRYNNGLYGLTGMLLYMEGKFITKTEGRFIQFLEGSKAAVLQVFNSICRDQRHLKVILLSSGTSSTRSFPEWSMGFSPVTAQQYYNMDGFFNLDEGLVMPEGKHYVTETTALLQIFYNLNMETGKVLQKGTQRLI